MNVEFVLGLELDNICSPTICHVLLHYSDQQLIHLVLEMLTHLKNMVSIIHVNICKWQVQGVSPWQTLPLNFRASLKLIDLSPPAHIFSDSNWSMDSKMPLVWFGYGGGVELR